LVECNLAKVDVAGSSPVARSKTNPSKGRRNAALFCFRLPSSYSLFTAAKHSGTTDAVLIEATAEKACSLVAGSAAVSASGFLYVDHEMGC
jgi:hypothetical protein